jgi:integrase
VKPQAPARAIRAFCNFLYENEYLSKPIKFEIPRDKAVRRPLPTVEEFQKLLESCETLKERLTVCLLADTGLRRQEACSLTWNDLDLATGTLKVLGKGGKFRTVFVGIHTRRMLLRFHNQSKSEKILNLQPYGLRTLLKRVGKRAGIDISPHQFRRFFATQAIVNGTDVLTLQRLLGHSSLQMTSLYVNLSINELQNGNHSIVDKLGIH